MRVIENKAAALLDGYSAKLATPFAVLGLRTRREHLIGIDYLPLGAPLLRPVDRFAREVCKQLSAYFDDASFRLDIPFEWNGTDYQMRVWEAVRKIPRGSTASYRDLAGVIGSAPRPVGTACGANRVPLLIPCHRVVGSGGIGGFMHARGGRPLDIKRWLLRHEGAID